MFQTIQILVMVGRALKQFCVSLSSKNEEIVLILGEQCPSQVMEVIGHGTCTSQGKKNYQMLQCSITWIALSFAIQWMWIELDKMQSKLLKRNFSFPSVIHLIQGNWNSTYAIACHTRSFYHQKVQWCKGIQLSISRLHIRSPFVHF